MIKRLAIALVVLPALVLSCASSGGSAYSRAESAESAAARAKKPAPPSSPSPRPATPAPRPTRPVPRPSEPAFPSRGADPLPPPRERGARIEIVIEEPRIEAKAPMGFLSVENLQPYSSIYVDGSRCAGPTVQLSLGSHNVRIVRFGFRDFEATVQIAWERATSLRAEQESAPFTIRDLELNPRTFDPEDPGYLGSCEAQVLVSARGSGRASVIDAEGRALRSLGSLAFEGPSTRLRWDGRDDEGRPVPSGDYVLRVEGEGSAGESDSAGAKVTIASGLFARSSILYSGVSGALFAPDARSLAAGKFEVATGAELHLAPRGDAMTGLGTAHAAFRLGLPSASGISELDVSYMSALWQGDPYANSFSMTAAFKASPGGAPLASPTAAAVYVKATIARFYSGGSESSVSPSWDGTTRYTGLSIGLPLEYASGSARAFASPELQVSDYYPNWSAAGARWTAPGFFAWAYLRLGLEATAGRYSIGLSGALRSAPFGGPFELAGPYPLGLEVRWHAPSSPLVLSFIATGEIESLSSYYFGAGIGLGFRY